MCRFMDYVEMYVDITYCVSTRHLQTSHKRIKLTLIQVSEKCQNIKLVPLLPLHGNRCHPTAIIIQLDVISTLQSTVST